MKARQTRIAAVENADVTKDQAIGKAQTDFVTAQSNLKVTLDNSYTKDAKTWNTAIQNYWNAHANLIQTEDNAIAQANAAQTSAVGSADAARDQAIEQAYSTMYGSIAAAY